MVVCFTLDLCCFMFCGFVGMFGFLVFVLFRFGVGLLADFCDFGLRKVVLVLWSL